MRIVLWGYFFLICFSINVSIMQSSELLHKIKDDDLTAALKNAGCIVDVTQNLASDSDNTNKNSANNYYWLLSEVLGYTRVLLPPVDFICGFPPLHKVINGTNPAPGSFSQQFNSSVEEWNMKPIATYRFYPHLNNGKTIQYGPGMVHITPGVEQSSPEQQRILIYNARNFYFNNGILWTQQVPGALSFIASLAITRHLNHTMIPRFNYLIKNRNRNAAVSQAILFIASYKMARLTFGVAFRHYFLKFGPGAAIKQGSKMTRSSIEDRCEQKDFDSTTDNEHTTI